MCLARWSLLFTLSTLVKVKWWNSNKCLGYSIWTLCAVADGSFSTSQVTQRKLHFAQSNLAECEQNRERKLKIMTKTHQSALALKQALIHELQCIIEEKDEMIKSMSQNGQTEIKLCVNQVFLYLHVQLSDSSLLPRFSVCNFEILVGA